MRNQFLEEGTLFCPLDIVSCPDGRRLVTVHSPSVHFGDVRKDRAVVSFLLPTTHFMHGFGQLIKTIIKIGMDCIP